MNYFYKNRDNSLYLPFDVMNIIYEYADPMVNIRKQIINKEFNLDNIMYERKIKEIKTYFKRGYCIDFYQIEYNDIENIIHKPVLLKHYKKYNLFNEYKRPIYGLDGRYNFLCQSGKFI